MSMKHIIQFRISKGEDGYYVAEGLDIPAVTQAKTLDKLAKNIQKGSHIKLKRINVSGIKQVLAIPNHKEIDRGTLKAIINQASQYIPEAELRKFFYN